MQAGGRRFDPDWLHQFLMLASECATTSAADAAVVVSSSLFNNLDVVRRENTQSLKVGVLKRVCCI